MLPAAPPSFICKNETEADAVNKSFGEEVDTSDDAVVEVVMPDDDDDELAAVV